jgi:alkylation response protein AidB-like acyl-CoA dehydrogenase
VPWPLIKRMGELGIVGEDIAGYGCPGLDPISCGLVMMELSRGDGSIATVLGVQSGLAMKSIAMLGSEEHKQRWLPQMARMEKLGAFALTEPDHGSDSVILETTARRDATSTSSTAPNAGSETAASPTSWSCGRATRTARSAASLSRRARPATTAR